jgi:hypothetical protein
MASIKTVIYIKYDKNCEENRNKIINLIEKFKENYHETNYYFNNNHNVIVISLEKSTIENFYNEVGKYNFSYNKIRTSYQMNEKNINKLLKTSINNNFITIEKNIKNDNEIHFTSLTPNIVHESLVREVFISSNIEMMKYSDIFIQNNNNKNNKNNINNDNFVKNKINKNIKKNNETYSLETEKSYKIIVKDNNAIVKNNKTIVKDNNAIITKNINKPQNCDTIDKEQYKNIDMEQLSDIIISKLMKQLFNNCVNK